MSSPESFGEVRSVVLAVVATGAGALPAFLIGGLAVQVRGELGFDEFQLGLLVSIYFGLSAALSVLAGRKVDWWGSRRSMLVVSAMSAGSLGLLALAGSWLWMVLGVSLGAVANAVAQPASNLLLSRRVRLDRQGFAFGLKQAAVPLASMAGGAAVPAFALTIGWRWAFAAGSIVSISVVLLAPTIRHTFPSGRRVSSETTARLSLPDRRALGVLAVGAFCGNVASNSLGVFLVEGLVVAGYAPAIAALGLTLGSALGLAGRVVVGLWADRSSKTTHFGLCSGMLGVGALGYLLFLPYDSVLNWVAIVLTFAGGWGWNGLFSYSVVASDRNKAALAIGASQTGLFAGATIGPSLFGYVVSVSGFPIAWRMASVSIFVGGLLVLYGGKLLRLASSP